MTGFDLVLEEGGSCLDILAAPAGGTAEVAKHPRGGDPVPILLATLAQWRIAPAEIRSVRVATTLAANALLDGTAAPVALITNRGFTDLPELGRQSRRDPDDLDPPPPTPPWLAPPEWRLGLGGRIGADGQEARATDLPDPRALPDAPIAVCLLFAPRNPAHELAVEAAIRSRRPDATISLSHRVNPADGEFERMLATLADAALRPLLAARFGAIAAAMVAAGLPAPLFLDARGDLLPAEAALAAPLGFAGSGPAASARAVAYWARGETAIGLDVGGTSTEVSLVRDGAALPAAALRLGDLVLRCPALDGESLAIAGDRSMGAGAPTLADAARAAGWLGGEAGPMPDTLEIAATALAEATRRIALRRHIHPDLALLVVGGGFGPLLGCEIADRMGTRCVLIPPSPGVMAGSGLLDAPALPARFVPRGGGRFEDPTATFRLPPGWRMSSRADGAVLAERA
jgi:N-methylhydantoinase A